VGLGLREKIRWEIGMCGEGLEVVWCGGGGGLMDCVL
jgi:hypothetical protein